MKKDFLFWLYFSVAILLMIYFAIRIVMTFFWHTPVSEVKSIYFSGNLDKSDIVLLQSTAGISSRGDNTFAISLDNVNERIYSQPEIKSSAVRRLGSGKLEIMVEKYEPVAHWTDGEFYYPVTENGIVISRPQQEKPANSFIFVGSGLNNLLPVIKSAKPLFGKINYIERIEERRWDIYTNDGLRILLPEKDVMAAVSKLVILEKEHQILSKDIKSLDMRDNNRILIKD